MKIKVGDVVKALDQLDRALKHPVAAAVIEGLRPHLPSFGMSAEQVAELQQLRGDYAARRARARKRAGA